MLQKYLRNKNNKMRFSRTNKLISDYRFVVGDQKGKYMSDDETILGDLLCDLQHWAQFRNVDFGQAMDQANYHFCFEAEGRE